MSDSDHTPVRVEHGDLTPLFTTAQREIYFNSWRLNRSIVLGLLSLALEGAPNWEGDSQSSDVADESHL
jgi:hypothetical protein